MKIKGKDSSIKKLYFLIVIICQIYKCNGELSNDTKMDKALGNSSNLANIEFKELFDAISQVRIHKNESIQFLKGELLFDPNNQLMKIISNANQSNEFEFQIDYLENYLCEYFPRLNEFTNDLINSKSNQSVINSILSKDQDLCILSENKSNRSLIFLLKFQREQDHNKISYLLKKNCETNLPKKSIIPDNFEIYFNSISSNSSLKSLFKNSFFSIYPISEEASKELIDDGNINETIKAKQFGLFFETGDDFKKNEEENKLSAYPILKINYEDIANCTVIFNDCRYQFNYKKTTIVFDIPRPNCSISHILKLFIEQKCKFNKRKYSSMHRFHQKFNYENFPKGEDLSSVIKFAKSPDFLSQLKKLSQPKEDNDAIKKALENLKKIKEVPESEFVDSPPKNRVSSVFDYPEPKYFQYFNKRESKLIEVPTVVSEAFVMTDKHGRAIDTKQVKPLEILKKKLEEDKERRERLAKQAEKSLPTESKKKKILTVKNVTNKTQEEIKKLKEEIESQESNMDEVKRELEEIQGTKNHSSKVESDVPPIPITKINEIRPEAKVKATNVNSTEGKKGKIFSVDAIPVNADNRIKGNSEDNIEDDSGPTRNNTSKSESEDISDSNNKSDDLSDEDKTLIHKSKKKKEEKNAKASHSDVDALKSYWISSKSKPKVKVDIEKNSNLEHSKLREILSTVNMDDHCEKKFGK